MPELPEVEVIRQGLVEDGLEGRRFLAVKPGDKRLRRQAGPGEFQRWVAGRRLLKLSRRGKYLLFGLEGGATLLIHLGMTGRLLLMPGPLPSPEPHVHLIFELDDGRALVYQDVRRFGQVLVFPPGVEPEPLHQVGREPFSPAVTPAWLAAQAAGHSRPIKNFLLDGRIVAGIGNIYACEILFAAGLHPATPVARLTPQDWARVLKETRRILKAAIAKGGTRIRDFLNSRGKAGLFRPCLQVYGFAGEICPRCRAATIERLVQAGRSSFFCPQCQKLPA
jgi:formamidopyrimidine-DNA glycosylase